MHELVGQTLRLDEGAFEIIEVRHVAGELLVVAESAAAADGLTRTSFRYPDIAAYLSESETETS